MGMKLIIAGSRTLNEVGLISAVIERNDILLDIKEVVSGCAKGIDTAGAEWAAIHGITIKSFPADWNKFGRSAGYIRNSEMAKYGDALLAIWDGHSKGTLNMITTMQKLEKPVYIMEVYYK